MEYLHSFLSNFIKDNIVSNYLEIGTRDGDSLKSVVFENQNIENVFVSDIWGPDYGGTNKKSHDHIAQLLDSIQYKGKSYFLDGDSKVTIPTLHDAYKDYFDLILVDGDHSYDGGMTDLVNVFTLCKSDGTILFDDIIHPAHTYLENCFDIFVTNHSNNILSTRKIYDGHGIGIIVKK